MRPYIQRIAAASLLLRSTRPVWTNKTYLKPTLTHTLPYYIQQQQQQQTSIDSNVRTLSTSRSIQLINTASAIIEEENNTNPKSNIASESFQFVAYAAWHPKTRQKAPASQKKVPYWKEDQKAGKVDAGEDAFFQTNTPEGLAIGVADGVGGWSLVGVDPALFSWTLMDNAAIIAKNEKSADAHQILDSAFHELRRSGKVAAGSSTACILNLSKTTGEMTTCNLGDSAFLLIRDKKIVYESPSQQHYFNCP